VSGSRVEDCIYEALVPADPKNPESARLPCLTLHLGRTKTIMDDARVVLISRPVTALNLAGARRNRRWRCAIGRSPLRSGA